MVTRNAVELKSDIKDASDANSAARVVVFAATEEIISEN